MGPAGKSVCVCVCASRALAWLCACVLSLVKICARAYACSYLCVCAHAVTSISLTFLGLRHYSPRLSFFSFGI